MSQHTIIFPNTAYLYAILYACILPLFMGHGLFLIRFMRIFLFSLIHCIEHYNVKYIDASSVIMIVIHGIGYDLLAYVHMFSLWSDLIHLCLLVLSKLAWGHLGYGGNKITKG